MMGKLIIHPQDIEIIAEDGQNLLELLKEHKHYVKSSCGGNGTCGDCVIKVRSDEPELPKLNMKEELMLGNVYHITKERLCCQLELKGKLTIDLSNHDSDRDKNKMNRPIKRRSANEVKTIINERVEKKKARMDEGKNAGWKKATKAPVNEKLEAKAKFEQEKIAKMKEEREASYKRTGRNTRFATESSKKSLQDQERKKFR